MDRFYSGRKMPYSSIIETIGRTPFVEINNLKPHAAVSVYAKLEGANPTGSLKDRIAKYMVEAAEAEGKLKPGTTILEPTSGNTGISLAMLAKLKGYRLVAVMPENVSVERRELLEAYGAEVVLTDGEKGTNGAIEVAEEMAAKEPSYFMPNQYSNPNNPRAHYETTAVEILEELPTVDAFVAGLGTGGTLMGVGRRLKEQNSRVKIVAVQPYPHGGLQGLRSVLDGFVPPILDLEQIDENFVVKDEQAFIMVQQLLQKEGIFAGISSGAVMHVIQQLGASMKSGTIVTLFPDDGWKYLSERLWSESPEKLKEQITGPLW